MLFAAAVMLMLPQRQGGDLPAFYSAGELARTRPEQLYDIETQETLQTPLITNGGRVEAVPFPYAPASMATFQYAPRIVIPFAYAPGVALAYAPLSLLPYWWACVVHAGLMLGALGGATWFAARRLPRIQRWMWPAMAASLLFIPLPRAIFGGQNSALSLLCASAAFSTQNPYARGAWLGLWLYKPQFAVPTLLVTGLRNPRVFLGAVPLVASWWLAGVWLRGPYWYSEWMSLAAAFSAYDRVCNAGLSISVADVFQVFNHTLTLVIGHVLLFSIAYRRERIAIPIMAAATPLLAPHALFYDASMALLALWVVADRGGRRTLGVLLGAWFVALLQLPLSESPGFGATFACIIAVVALLAVERESAPTRRQPLSSASFAKEGA